MSITVAQVIEQCGKDLHDEAQTTWADGAYYRPVYEAELAIKRQRPAAFLNSTGSKTTDPTLPTLTTDTLSVADDYFSAVCEHVMGALYLTDGEGRFDQAKSDAHFAKFMALMKGAL